MIVKPTSSPGFEIAHSKSKAVPRISVIIPTLCEAARSGAIHRAITSIRNSSREPVLILVVVNGDRFDPTLLDTLRASPGVAVLQLAVASVTEAQLAGRRAVKTEYFSFLDDDDEYLPGALDHRLELLGGEQGYDLAVTEGYWTAEGVDSPLYGDLSDVPSDPLAAVLKRGWLNSANCLFKSSSVPADYFLDLEVHGEWTWLAFRLAMDRKKVVASNRPTFRYHDTPQSLSKSINHSKGYIRLFEHMLRKDPTEPYRSMIRKRLAQAHHDHSELLLGEGQRRHATKHHLRSLAYPGGWKYLPYTRHLIHALISGSASPRVG